MRRLGGSWALGLSLLSLALAIYSYRMAGHRPAVPKVTNLGQRLDTAFVSVQGKHIRIPDGELHVLVFFTPTCGACQLALTHLDRLAAARELRAELVGVGRGSCKEIERFGAQNCPHILLIADPDGVLFRKFHVIRVPACLEVDRQGQCIRIVEGCFGLDGTLEGDLAHFIGLNE